jgi:hypothetical protein
MERGKRRGSFAPGALRLAWPAVIACVGLLAPVGCIDINGGAVEIAWAAFTKDGRAITDCSCADPSIATVRLNLVSDPDGASQPCADLAACRFACNRKIGATSFMIPPGRYLMSLVAVGADGVDLPVSAVESPAPQSREVVSGQPTELEAYMLRTNCAVQCNSADFTQPCTGG